MGPNTERDYREALEVAGLLHGAVDDRPELAVLKEAVQQHLAKAAPAQMTSSIADWEPRIVELAEEGLTAKPIYDRLRLEEPDFRGGFYAVLRPLTHDEPPDLYEIIRQRYQHGATIITSNRDVEEWYPLFGDALLASAAIVDGSLIP